MLPGWTCTINFWKHKVAELAKTCKFNDMEMLTRTCYNIEYIPR